MYVKKVAGDMGRVAGDGWRENEDGRKEMTADR